MVDICFWTANTALPGNKANVASWFPRISGAQLPHRCRLMSRHYKYLKLALLGSSAMVIVAACVTDSSEYRDILSVSDITQNVMDAGTDPVVCDDFRMSTKEVVYYFRHAREVSNGISAHDLEYAPCRVTGKLTLDNRITATWEINLSGVGHVVFDDGEVKLFSCRRCIPKRWRVSE
jgi:hypothetical protein